MKNAIVYYRLAHWLFKKKIPFLPKIITAFIFMLYNSYIPYSCEIGEKTVFGYGGMGVVLHPRCVIGKSCLIGQQVTIGGRSKHEAVPVIGDNVFIATGAKVLGPIKIGNNCVIGANAVVVKDVPDNSVAAGVPAKIIKTGIDYKDYI